MLEQLSVNLIMTFILQYLNKIGNFVIVNVLNDKCAVMVAVVYHRIRTFSVSIWCTIKLQQCTGDSKTKKGV